MSGVSILKALHKRLLRDTLGRTQRENLARLISSLLPDREAAVLDIGCGNGLFSRDLMTMKPNLHIIGVETVTREDSYIRQSAYDGNILPFADKSFDYAMLINVLHHTDDPARVLREASRVAREGVIVKDHYANTRFDFYNLVAMEMVGNTFSGISQPYHFLSEKEWGGLFGQLHMKSEKLLTRFVSYNRFFDIFLGRNLHFIARLVE
jgi:ubiquinone/menaquinone biosynthesis C-methylase UbiE